jgi:long-subunit acyl-CoA synthetase (AMP-forming)
MEKLYSKKLPYRSIPQMLQINAEKHADRPALSFKRGGGYLTLNYQQFYIRVLMAARGLGKAGIQPGDKVAIFSENRAGWAIADLAIQWSQCPYLRDQHRGSGRLRDQSQRCKDYFYF